MDAKRRKRILRQHLLTDHLMGVRTVPIGTRSNTLTEGLSQPNDAPNSPSTHSAGLKTSTPRSSASTNQVVTPIQGSLGAPMQPGLHKQLDSATKIRILTELRQTEVEGCTKCILCERRTQTVFGEGDPDAKLMFIGEGPGETEDKTGRPFVGRAGELLDKMIVAMGYKREDVYIANVVKCRPPGNRAPTPVEVEACWGYLKRQLMTIQPRAIVTLGGPAAKLILSTDRNISSIRGQWDTFRGLSPEGPYIPVMPTFHPAYVLRNYNEETRRKVWSDLKRVKSFLDSDAATPS